MAAEESASPDNVMAALSKKLGPLPVGVWIVLGVGVLYYVRKRQSSSSGTGAQQDSAGNTGTIDPATGYVYGSPQDQSALSAGSAGSNGSTSTGVTSGSTVAGTYTDNNSWARAAINYLVGLGVDPSVANEAVQQYLSSQVLTPEQQGDVNLAIQGIGSPPNLPGPVGTAPASIVNTGNQTSVSASNPPSGLTGTPANTSISLVWGSVTNATGYTVSYGTTTQASDGQQTTSGTSATIGGLKPSTMYYIHVQATPAKPGDPYASTTVTTAKSGTPTTGTNTAAGTLPPGYGWFDTASETYTADSIARRFGISVQTLNQLNGTSWNGSTIVPRNTHVKVRGNAGSFNLAAYKAL